MERPWLENPVFRNVERQARGLLPVLPQEAFVSFVVVLGAAVFLSWAWAATCGIATLCGLFVWRCAEHDRSDYFIIFVRRHSPQTRRCYNACAPDTTYRSMDFSVARRS